MLITMATSAPQSMSVVTPLTAMVSTTWQVMCGSGATIGTATTLIHQPLTLQVQRVARTACVAGALGTIRLSTCVVPLAAAAARRMIAATSVFGYLQLNDHWMVANEQGRVDP